MKKINDKIHQLKVELDAITSEKFSYIFNADKLSLHKVNEYNELIKNINLKISSYEECLEYYAPKTNLKKIKPKE